MRKEGYIGMPTREGWIGAVAVALLMVGSVASADDSCRTLQMKGDAVHCYEGNKVSHFPGPYSSGHSKTFWDKVKPCEDFSRKIQTANKSEVEHNSSVEFSTNEDGSCNITFKLGSK